MFSAFATRIARLATPPSSTSSLQAFAASLVGVGGATSPVSVGTALVLGGVSLGSYEYVSKTSGVTVSSFVASDWFTSTADVGAIVVVNGNLTINSGVTFTPPVRKRFVCIYVNGTLTLNGSVTMTGRGGEGFASFIQLSSTLKINSESCGAGGAARSTNGAGNNGASRDTPPFVLLGTGGGGGGSSFQGIGRPANATAGSGAAGTCFGGGGGGGGSGNPSLPGGNAVANGGAGGTAGELSNGGCGNPSGTTVTADSTVGPGTGGVAIVFATSTVSGSGSITSLGSNNFGVNNVQPVIAGNPGGASGGGCVVLIAPNNTLSLSAAGGTSSVSGSWPHGNKGGDGGAGSATFVVI